MGGPIPKRHIYFMDRPTTFAWRCFMNGPTIFTKGYHMGGPTAYAWRCLMSGPTMLYVNTTWVSPPLLHGGTI
jgi:hypothetical protein